MTSHERYPAETLPADEDDGTMPENVGTLREAVIGRKIVSAGKVPGIRDEYGRGRAENFLLELDNGTQVRLVDTDDCCACTELEAFLLHPEMVDHVIIGVGTTERYTKWHIYADAGDVLELTVGWSAGNPFYYGYGFDITVEPVVIDAEVVATDQRAIGG